MGVSYVTNPRSFCLKLHLTDNGHFEKKKLPRDVVRVAGWHTLANRGNQTWRTVPGARQKLRDFGVGP